MADLDAEARALYERNVMVGPSWDQLGDVTKSVWREDVEAKRGQPSRPPAVFAAPPAAAASAHESEPVFTPPQRKPAHPVAGAPVQVDLQEVDKPVSKPAQPDLFG